MIYVASRCAPFAVKRRLRRSANPTRSGHRSQNQSGAGLPAIAAVNGELPQLVVVAAVSRSTILRITGAAKSTTGRIAAQEVSHDLSQVAVKQESERKGAQETAAARAQVIPD
jgi:hypothetical protein